ncbi:3707_t:CDS:1 [Paraglomus occultum]|uniref:3707_t:CDS:1 n=1 Tax=Paraglomus occultum TaxID=144539 RepID=A0A9N9FIB9_9GLOM|nr:3707_t:CDS:1 [Paraglomus occultum]
MTFHSSDPNVRSNLVNEHHIINNGKDFNFYCNTSSSCHIGNALYFIARSSEQSLHYISGCNSGSHNVRYVKNDEELSSITMCNMHPNHEDFYICSDNDGIFSCTPNHVGYFVQHFSKYDIYYHDGGNSNNDGGNSAYANSYNYYHYNHHHHYSSYSYINNYFNKTINDVGSSSVPVENSNINAIVVYTNAPIRTHNACKNNKAELDIINGVILADYKDCIVYLELPSEEDILNMIKMWRKRGRGTKRVNLFMVYRALLSKNLEYKKKEFQNGGFQCYISEFASKTWRKKSESAKKAIETLAVKINMYIEEANIRSTL